MNLYFLNDNYKGWVFDLYRVLNCRWVKSKRSNGIDIKVLYKDVVKFCSNCHKWGDVENILKWAICGFYRQYFFHNAIVFLVSFENWYFWKYEVKFFWRFQKCIKCRYEFCMILLSIGNRAEYFLKIDLKSVDKKLWMRAMR